jgi:heme-degrading monooxygenase HmoA
VAAAGPGVREERPTKEGAMVAVFVSFIYESDVNEAKIRAIAEGASPKFKGIPGLRSKIFTVQPEKRQATNVYLWDSEEAARAFFTDEMRERVAALYGTKPTIEFAAVAAAVENR